MDYFLKNTTGQPINCEAINVVIPAKSKMSRPLRMEEKRILDTCGITYDGLLLEPVLMEAGSSGLANEDAGSSELASADMLASKRGAGRKPKGD